MMKLMTKSRGRQRGSALVESSLCLLGFMFLTLGVMEFSMAVYAYNFCSYAARDASRWASVRGSQSTTPATPDQVTAYVQSRAIAIPTSSLAVTTTWISDNNPGSQVKVNVACSIVPLVGLALRNTLQVASASQMVIVH